MEAVLSEFEYFTPSVIQSAVIAEYDDMISPTGAINPDQANPLNTLEFAIPGATDLYRDLNNSYLMLKLKLVQGDGTNVANDIAAAPVNLPLHSLFSNVNVTLCGKELTEKDSLYPYRAYLETLLSYNPDVLKTRFVGEGWAKDQAGKMDAIVHADAGNLNSGFVERRKLVLGSRAFTLVGRLHDDLFHQSLDIPPDCTITVKLVPSPTAFALMEAANGTDKFVLFDAKLFVRTKKVCPELVVAHKEMLQRANMRFPLNRVTVTKHGIAAGYKSISIPLNFPAKLPKRLFIGFVANSATTGTRNENPFNFRNFGLKSLNVTVNGIQIPAAGLEMDFANHDCQRAYLNTLAALGLDNDNRAIDLTPDDFENGFAIFGFKIAPGPIEGVVHTVANRVGSLTVNIVFSVAITANVDMIVFAETPATLEIDKLSAVTLV
jgi:hypothetical protein